MNESNISNSAANNNFLIRLSAGGRESRGIAKAHLWSSTERNKRALRSLGVTWALAVISIVLPLAHFVLVPGLLVAGPFVFFWFKKQAGKILEVQAKCPFCEKELMVGVSSIEWPLRVVCKACSEPVRIDVERGEMN